MTVDNRKKIEATYHQGLRCIHAETKYTQLKYGTRTNLGVRQDLQALDIHHTIYSRRLGLLKRVQDSNSEWLLGLIVDQWEAPRGWTKEVRNDLEALAKLEVGVTPRPSQMIVQAKDTTKKRWMVRLKTAQAAAMLMQDTQDDLENLEKFQQSAFVSVGLKVGAPPVKADWACPQCQKCFTNKQAMRMHETVVHKLKHIAHDYLPATNCPMCMREYHTKDKAIRHLKTTQKCLHRLRFYKPNGLGESAETAEGLELARLKAEPMIRRAGPLLWEIYFPIGPLPHHHQVT